MAGGTHSLSGPSPNCRATAARMTSPDLESMPPASGRDDSEDWDMNRFCREFARRREIFHGKSKPSHYTGSARLSGKTFLPARGDSGVTDRLAATVPLTGKTCENRSVCRFG